MTEAQFLIFIVASLAIIVTPGQDFVLVMSRGVSLGSKAGAVTAAGVSTGLLGHTLLATFGLGALLMASNVAFTLIKYLGASYLVYLGLRLVLFKAGSIETTQNETRSLGSCFVTGALSNISNPKITIFYFAYLPQFLEQGKTDPLMLLMLGSLFSLLTFIVKMPLGYYAGKLSSWLMNSAQVLQWFNRLSGAVLIGLGVKLAFESR